MAVGVRVGREVTVAVGVNAGTTVAVDVETIVGDMVGIDSLIGWLHPNREAIARIAKVISFAVGCIDLYTFHFSNGEL